MLVIHWLVLSSPDGTFSVDRPRLPGQEKPGLGLLNPTLALLKSLARELSVDGVLDVPDHFHTALFYSRAFLYLDPEAEGRFLAIARDLSGIPLAQASDASGRVPRRPDHRCLDPLAHRGTGAGVARTTAPFPSLPSYREARNRALADHRFVVNWDLYRENLARRDSP